MNKKVIRVLALTTGLILASASVYAAKEECDQSWPAGRESGKQVMHETHMEKLHTALHLTPAQEAAWTDFAGKMKPVNTTPPKVQDWKGMSAPDRMDKMLENMKSRQSSMAEKAAAVRQFYDNLSVDQQRTFDRQFQRKDRGHVRHAMYHNTK
ncbi:MAG: Spy/CpxP family protein refolding chaperone [Gallionella sp.]